MKNRKKLISIIVMLFIVLVIGIIVGLNYKKYSNNKRYEIIKKDVEEETVRYLKVSHPYCTPGSGSFTINEDTLLVQWAMDKEKLLDVDGRSYCKARIEVTCIDENKLDTDVYIKCIEYEDKNYSNWEGRYTFVATIIESNGNSIVVEPVKGSHESKSSDKIIIKKITNQNYVIGDKVKITYDGIINESYPAQISATEIELLK